MSRLLFLVLFAQAAFGLPAYVQSKSIASASVTSNAVTLTSATTAHNMLLAFVRMSGATSTATITGSSGETWTLIVNQQQTSNGHAIAAYYAKDIAGGSDTVTATYNASNAHAFLAVYEVSGLSRTAPLDVFTSFSSTTTTSTAASVGPTSTTTTANEFVFAGFGQPSTTTDTPSAGTGYTLGENSTSNVADAATEYRVVSSTGAQTAVMNYTTAIEYSGIIVTFAAAAPSTISLVQSNINYTGQNSTTSTPPAAPTVGNYLVMFCGQYSASMSSATTMAFSDNYGNTYHPIQTYWDSVDGGLLQGMAIAKITSSGSGFVATCTNSAGATTLAVAYTAEYAGLSLGIDQKVAQNYSAGATNSCSSITTSTSDEAIIFAVVSSSGSTSWSLTTPPTGFTQRQFDPDGGPGFASSYMDSFVTASGTVVALNFANSDTAVGGNCMAVSIKSASTNPITGFMPSNNPVVF